MRIYKCILNYKFKYIHTCVCILYLVYLYSRLLIAAFVRFVLIDELKEVLLWLMLIPANIRSIRILPLSKSCNSCYWLQTYPGFTWNMPLLCCTCAWHFLWHINQSCCLPLLQHNDQPNHMRSISWQSRHVNINSCDIWQYMKIIKLQKLI